MGRQPWIIFSSNKNPGIYTVSISFGEDDRSVHKHIVYIRYLSSSYIYPSLCMERERDAKIDGSPDNQKGVAPHLYKPL